MNLDQQLAPIWYYDEDMYCSNLKQENNNDKMELHYAHLKISEMFN